MNVREKEYKRERERKKQAEKERKGLVTNASRDSRGRMRVWERVHVLNRLVWDGSNGERDEAYFPRDFRRNTRAQARIVDTDTDPRLIIRSSPAFHPYSCVFALDNTIGIETLCHISLCSSRGDIHRAAVCRFATRLLRRLFVVSLSRGYLRAAISCRGRLRFPCMLL